MAHKLANNPVTELNGGINATTTSIVVASADGFPSSGTFYIRIDDEIMKVTGVSGTTWTVVRASEVYDGTQVAASHANGAPVRQVLTAATMWGFRNTVAGLETPSGVSVQNIGTSGSTTYTYRVTAVSATGETLASSATSTTTGNATLNGTNFNRITWTPVPGAVNYKVYRTVSGGTPSSLGVIGSPVLATLDDTGLAGGSESVPSADTSFFVGIGTTAPTVAIDVTGSGVFSGGLAIGFAGTPVADRIQLGDANFYIDFSGTNPTIQWDTNDKIQYVRSTNKLEFITGNVAVISTDGDGNAAYAQQLSTDNATTQRQGAGLVIWAGDGTDLFQQFFNLQWTPTPQRARIIGFIDGGSTAEWASIKDSTGWSAASSRNTKTDIRDVTAAEVNHLVGQIRNLELKAYKRKDDLEGKLEFGVVAETAPIEITGGEDKTTVNPIRWLGVLTAVIQDLIKRVQALEARP